MGALGSIVVSVAWFFLLMFFIYYAGQVYYRAYDFCRYWPKPLHEFLQANVANAREPDQLIGEKDDVYLRRWYLTPWSRYNRNKPPSWTKFTKPFLPNVYLHQFLRSDYDEALHDHPWAFNISFILDGVYREHTSEGIKFCPTGMIKLRLGCAPHRVELLGYAIAVEGRKEPTAIREVPTWTLFVTGPVVRNWGFYCPKGWVPWQKFVKSYGEERLGCE